LAPIDAETEEEPAAGEEHAAIYGSETDPMDSQLDLARAYIDMGDEEGARPVLMSVIKEGDLSQQAQARELLLRIEAT
jgi:pilus assembly protein FimV